MMSEDGVEIGHVRSGGHGVGVIIEPQESLLDDDDVLAAAPLPPDDDAAPPHDMGESLSLDGGEGATGRKVGIRMLTVLAAASWAFFFLVVGLGEGLGARSSAAASAASRASSQQQGGGGAPTDFPTYLSKSSKDSEDAEARGGGPRSKSGKEGLGALEGPSNDFDMSYAFGDVAEEDSSEGVR